MPEFFPSRPRRDPRWAMFETQKRINESLSYRKSSQKWLERANPHKVDKVPTYEIGSDQVYLGHTSLEYSYKNVFAPEMPIVAMEGGHLRTKPKVSYLLAEKGAGKSLLEWLIASALIRKHHLPTCILDLAPNAEWYMHQYPLQKVVSGTSLELTKDLFTHFPDTLKLEGFTTRVYRPALSGRFREEGTDVDYALTLEDIRTIDYFNPAAAEDTLLTILDLTDSRPARVMAKSLISNRSIRTFSEFMQLHKDDRDRPVEERMMVDLGTTFPAYLHTSLENRELSSEQPKYDFIADAASHDYVVLRGKPRKSENESASFMKVQATLDAYLTRFLDERRKFVSGTQREKIDSKFDNPAGILVIADEMKEVAPRRGNSYMRDNIDNLALLDRKNGTNIIAATQDAGLVSENIPKSADYVFFSHIKGSDKGESSTESALKAAGVPKSIIEEAKKSPEHQVNSLGFPVNLWFMWDKHSIRRFYPGVDGSAYKIT